MGGELKGSFGQSCFVFKQPETREPVNSTETQAVLEAIREQEGYLDEEILRDLHTLGQRSQDRLLKIIKLKRETEAVPTMNISERVHTSGFHFLYRLIQHADEASYLNRGVLPFLRLEVTPEAIVVETNEDEFKTADIEAMCATGRNSKKAAASGDHTDQKRVGFKSVFSVADKVHVQSGLWSFSLQHGRGENDLGMTTLLNMPPDTLPVGVTTRITLRYSDKTKKEYSRLLEAVQNLPLSTVLFLQRLCTIHINITGLDGKCEKTSFNNTREYYLKPLRCTLTQTKEADGSKNTKRCTYLVFKTTKQNMPHHEYRRGRKEAKVELAFPIDPATQQPKLSDVGQNVFTYFPLQRLAQIQLLIHSDFVTSASREGVDDCPWNEAICTGIAETFVSAVVNTFAKPNHPLRHSWLEYLPEAMVDRPWKSLYTLIIDSLATKPVAQTREQGMFKAPSQLRTLSRSMMYNEEPILPDLPGEIYLAPDYTLKHEKRLEELGVQSINRDQLIDRLQADLLRPQSKTKTTTATDPWHEAFASMFLPILADSEDFAAGLQQHRLKLLPIIPLIGNNQWTVAPSVSSGGSDQVYFAVTGLTPIPETISLRLLDQTASKNLKRKAFYTALGVKECPKETVFTKIEATHRGICTPYGIIDQLRYMFHQGYNPEGVKFWVRVPVTSGETIKALSHEIFFPSDGQFDMYQLVPQKSQAMYVFLSEALFDAELSTVRVDNETWREWLARATESRYYPRLKGASYFNGDIPLSSAMEAVLKHSPTKFLDMLRAHWDTYREDAVSVQKALRNCAVPCQSGSSNPLHSTYLPTFDILIEASRLKIDKNALPLLNLEDGTPEKPTYTLWKILDQSWTFLEDFGAKSEPDLEFYGLAIKARSTAAKNPNLKEVAEIYKCMANLGTTQSYNAFQRHFDTSPQIWDGHRKRWVTRGQCIWDGPDFISSKTVLKRTYSGDFLLYRIFTTMLDIPSLKIEHIIKEIEQRRDSSCSNVDRVFMRDIYTYLASKASTNEDWQKIKSEFTEKRLVLGEHGIWYNLPACLWKSPFALADFQELSKIYPSLEDFFVERMQVNNASPIMLIHEVKRMTGVTPPQINEIRTCLIKIATILAKSTIDVGIANALASLMEGKSLPKKVGGSTSVLVGVIDSFAIPDHPRYAKAFANQNVLLDFQIHEVLSLHVIFQYMGLKHRYLSYMVQEVSTVDERCIKNDALSQQIQAKAYALYCCAAKHKSKKALPGDHTLYEQLSQGIIYTTDKMSTNLVLPLLTGRVSVQSDRAVIHSDISAGKIQIYVPSDARQRKVCYRSQLPELLTSVLGVGQAATFNVASIIASTLEDLDDVLIEQDIPPVEWIDKPVVVIPKVVEPERPSTPSSFFDVTTLVDPRSGLITPDATPKRCSRETTALDLRDFAETTLPGTVSQTC